MINELIKKLRFAADALDSLLTSFPKENRKAAHSIRRNMDDVLNGNDKPKRAYKRKHWTQTPEGRKKMSKAMKKAYANGRTGLNKLRG